MIDSLLAAFSMAFGLNALIAVVLGTFIGLVFGSIPGLNENLHLNLWFVIPVSGVLVGGLLGLMQRAHGF